jgi:hypothetical protein
MPAITFFLALLLLAVGLGGYVASGAHAPTALIPAGLGLLLVVCAAVGRNPKARMHAMHAAVVFALLGFLGSVRGVLQLPAFLAGQPVARPLAVVAQSITVVLCLAYLVVAIRSFIQARRARLAAQAPKP